MEWEHSSPIRIENIKMFNILNNDEQTMNESRAFNKCKIWIYYSRPSCEFFGERRNVLGQQCHE